MIKQKPSGVPDEFKSKFKIAPKERQALIKRIARNPRLFQGAPLLDAELDLVEEEVLRVVYAADRDNPVDYSVFQAHDERTEYLMLIMVAVARSRWEEEGLIENLEIPGRHTFVQTGVGRRRALQLTNQKGFYPKNK